jgi:hypothetical protein
MATDLVMIHSVGKLYQAELIRQMLSDHNIYSFVVNKQNSAYIFTGTM